MEDYNLYFEANRSLWNKKTPVHLNSDFYNLPAFMAGETSLNQIELSELGNVKGKSMLHLQCHFGQDTLSWARLGADVTGIDISDEAIRQAEILRDKLNLEATFVRSDLYNLKENLQGQFDIVFTSYGTIGWLPDLNKWADIIDHFLKLGGTFYIAEFHPVLWMFDDNFEKIVYPYHNTHTPIVTESEGTYADRNAPIKQVEYGWNHGLGEVVTALTSRGIYPEFLHEFPYSPYNCFANMVQGEDGFWRIKGYEDKLPMVYSIKATKMDR
ncbi:SAM-dependent methyltransferase [Pontibacter aydingkolensis]|uniref:Class I SAM-dependent methyltransferase n=1 Tax=Pontibacter aydingkolensis TaxID=1911536 RepID=A0ABS7CZS1_9BACT|nr:class I SAM-dependent methyltransferase [Pontibacter aydingkolensis]MBW7469353.1 class I SAM-dependent methyltransferase [Pontibacter aydingkolensis]